MKHPFKSNVNNRKHKQVNKSKLRNKIEIETEKFLKTNKITHLPNSPNGKVPEVRVKSLGAFTDAHEFYYLEEDDNQYNRRLI